MTGGPPSNRYPAIRGPQLVPVGPVAARRTAPPRRMTFEVRVPPGGRRSDFRVPFRILLFGLIAAVAAAIWLNSSATGQDLLLRARIRWASLPGPARSAVLGRLFDSTLTRSLHAAGIDTSLIRFEPAGPGNSGTPGNSGMARWEIPLPDGFATPRGNAIVTRAVERLGGRAADAVA